MVSTMISAFLFCTLIYHIAGNHISNNEIEWSAISTRKGVKSPAVEIQDELDILKLMNVSAKEQGVSAVDGPILNFPAYKFRLPYENVPLSNSSAVTNDMSSKSGFTVVFLYRQQKNNLGTLLSVNSPGKLTPWFQINSNSKTNTLNLKYILKGSTKIHQHEWSLPNRHRKAPLAAWIWVSVSLDFTTSTIRLDLDCQPSRFESLTSRKAQSRIKIPKDSLVYFRQEPGRKKKFLGSMQVAKILPYVSDQRLWSCTHITDNPEPAHRKPLI